MPKHCPDRLYVCVTETETETNKMIHICVRVSSCDGSAIAPFQAAAMATWHCSLELDEA